MAKTLTTCNLITTSLRRAMIPSDQSTFTCCDIIEIMNEEIGIHILPMVLRAHEEYYVIDEDQALSACTIRYKIPYRAVGNKLRDVQFIDNAGTQYEMTRVSLEDRPEYQGSYTNNQFLTFYLENDSIVLMQNQISNGSIRSSYYLRPNDLVKDERAGKIQAVTNPTICVTITSDSLLVGDSISVGGISFVATVCVVVEGAATFQSTSNAGAAISLAAQINAHATASTVVNATASCSIVSIVSAGATASIAVTYVDNGTIGATVGCEQRTFTLVCCSSGFVFPPHFSCALSSNICIAFCFDIIQGKSPNKIIGFDRTAASINATASTVTFNTCQLTTLDLFSITPQQLTFSVGDYLMQSEETIVPQLPAELQPIIAQRTAIKMLEALGDVEGMKMSQNELERMEYNAMTLIDNRVEGAPQKITNRHSILKSSLSNKLYRRRGL